MRSDESTPCVLITTAAISIWAFFRQQIPSLSQAGFSVSTICSPGEVLASCRTELGIDMHEVPMKRSISPVSDLGSLVHLYSILRLVRPKIVHTHTPKAGLLGMIAGFVARIPIRIYSVNGIVWETKRGVRRWILQSADRIAARLSTAVLCVSPSVRRTLVDNRICPAEKAKVLGCGASHGVDFKKFDPSRFTHTYRDSLRSRFGVPHTAKLIGFVGRMVRDKGIEDLTVAWQSLRGDRSDLYLILIGPTEPNDPIPAATWAALSGDPRVVLAGGIMEDMAAIYSILDFCVLPTYREGLPNVLLEAAAMRVPVVATRVTGCVDVVIDGETGLLVEPRNPERLLKALRRLLTDGEYAVKLTERGHAYVRAHFSEPVVSMQLIDEYRRLISEDVSLGHTAAGGRRSSK